MGLSILFVGCDNDPHEALIKESISVLSGMGVVLESVIDEPTATLAIEELKKFTEQMNDLQLRTMEIGEPDEEKIESLMNQYGDEMNSLSEKLMNEMVRLSEADYASTLIETLFPQP
jgi:hypothetical protein